MWVHLHIPFCTPTEKNPRIFPCVNRMILQIGFQSASDALANGLKLSTKSFVFKAHKNSLHTVHWVWSLAERMLRSTFAGCRAEEIGEQTVEFINQEYPSLVSETHGNHAKFIQIVYKCWGEVSWHPLLFEDKNIVLYLEMSVCVDHLTGALRNHSHSICNPIPLGDMPDRVL